MPLSDDIVNVVVKVMNDGATDMAQHKRNHGDENHLNGRRHCLMMPHATRGLLSSHSPASEEIDINFWEDLLLVDAKLSHQGFGDGFSFNLALPVPQHDLQFHKCSQPLRRQYARGFDR
jgi:hypothetical protein